MCGLLASLPLGAAVTMAELQERVDEQKLVDKELMLFHTAAHEVMVVGTPTGEVGAVLVQGKEKEVSAASLLPELRKVLPSEEENKKLISTDKRNMVLIYKSAMEDSDGWQGEERLKALIWCVTHVGEKVLPRRWHGSGVSFACSLKDTPVCEVTLDMGNPKVEYLELRLTENVEVVKWLYKRNTHENDDFSSNDKFKSYRQRCHRVATELLGVGEYYSNNRDFDADEGFFSSKDKKKIRKRRKRIRDLGGELVAANGMKPVIICRDRVYVMGRDMQARLKKFNQSSVSYFFSPLNFPKKVATLLSPEPQQIKQEQPSPQPAPPPPMTVEEKKPEPLTPEEARRAYLERLKAL